MRASALPAKQAVGLLGLVLFMGCAEPESKPIQVHWQLIDGRLCTDAGTVRAVLTTADGTEYSGRCSLLPDGNRIEIPTATAGSQLTARAESASLAVLYRGSILLPDKLPDLLELVLHFSGGR